MARHYRSKHSRETPFQCEHCQRAFSRRSVLSPPYPPPPFGPADPRIARSSTVTCSADITRPAHRPRLVVVIPLTCAKANRRTTLSLRRRPSPSKLGCRTPASRSLDPAPRRIRRMTRTSRCQSRPLRLCSRPIPFRALRLPEVSRHLCTPSRPTRSRPTRPLPPSQRRTGLPTIIVRKRTCSLRSRPLRRTFQSRPACPLRTFLPPPALPTLNCHLHRHLRLTCCSTRRSDATRPSYPTRDVRRRRRVSAQSKSQHPLRSLPLPIPRSSTAEDSVSRRTRSRRACPGRARSPRTRCSRPKSCVT
jgi:hypothetical protein